MRMKIPNCSVNNSYYACGDRETYDSDPEDYATPPNEESSENVEDFSEYMWMENEEEFDKLEMQRLEEEALMEQCIEAMLQDELEAEDAAVVDNLSNNTENTPASDLCEVLSTLHVVALDIEKSTLNPMAAEFVPSVVPLVPPASS